MTVLPRVCIHIGHGGCSDKGIAVPGRSRCKAHGGKVWAGQPASRQAKYNDPTYKANRATILRGGPLCHWCGVWPATTADHLLELAQGGTNDLKNLVPACERCNRLRGASLGGRVTRARRKQTNVIPIRRNR